MPLLKSSKKSAIGENIRREKHAHPDMPIKQAAAIAYSVKRKAASKKAHSKGHKTLRGVRK